MDHLLNPQPAEGLLCCLCGGSEGLLHLHACDAQKAVGLPQEVIRKASTVHSSELTPSSTKSADLTHVLSLASSGTVSFSMTTCFG